MGNPTPALAASGLRTKRCRLPGPVRRRTHRRCPSALRFFAEPRAKVAGAPVMWFGGGAVSRWCWAGVVAAWWSSGCRAS